jgi:hypothetical protein
MSEESLKSPDGLKTAGRQLWDSVTATFVLNAGEIEILRQAAATADEIALLEAELRAESGLRPGQRHARTAANARWRRGTMRPFRLYRAVIGENHRGF